MTVTTVTAGYSRPAHSPATPPYLVLIKHVEDKQSELGGVSKREELLVDLLEAHSIELTTRTVLDEALVPSTGKETQGVMVTRIIQNNRLYKKQKHYDNYTDYYEQLCNLTVCMRETHFLHKKTHLISF